MSDSSTPPPLDPPPRPPQAAPSSPPSSVPPPKKGLPGIAWVGIGCGGVLVLIIIGVVVVGIYAAKKVSEEVDKFKDNPEGRMAELIVDANPDVDFVSSDREAGEITVKNKKTGEEVTLSYADVKEGRLMMKSSDGSQIEWGVGNVEDIPDWVPIFEPNRQLNLTGRRVTSTEESGMLNFATSRPVQEAVDFYREELGSTVTEETVMGQVVIFASEDKENRRKINTQIMKIEEGTKVVVTYETKKK